MVVTSLFPADCLCFRLQELVVEKHTHMKESMRMMGLGNWVHWLAWFTKSYLVLLVPVLAIVIILKVCDMTIACQTFYSG